MYLRDATGPGPLLEYFLSPKITPPEISLYFPSIPAPLMPQTQERQGLSCQREHSPTSPVTHLFYLLTGKALQLGPQCHPDPRPPSFPLQPHPWAQLSSTPKQKAINCRKKKDKKKGREEKRRKENQLFVICFFISMWLIPFLKFNSPWEGWKLLPKNSYSLVLQGHER